MMRNADQILLENLYGEILLEARNSAFLKELDSLYYKWNDIQSKIKGTIPSYRHGPDGEPWDAPDAGQKIDKKDLPVYYQNKKTSVDKNTEHPNLRRVYFKQTDAEVELEKELLRIYQKYADQNYFRDEILFSHDFGYHAAAGIPPKDVPQRDEAEEYYLKNENKIYKNVLSCHGRDVSEIGFRNIGDYGIIVKGHVIFASKLDLASQTTRQAPDFVRDYFKNSGIPKRPSITNVHSTEETNSTLKIRQKFLKMRSKPPMTQEEKNDLLNSVVLDKNDGPRIEEALLGNWKIESWFFSSLTTKDGSTYPFPYRFWKKAYENNIQKPVYYFKLNSDEEPIQVNLAQYFEK